MCQQPELSDDRRCSGILHQIVERVLASCISQGMTDRLDTPGNPDLLRTLIDSGKTFDKVRFPDPSAAPLGTDDEAGGFPPSAAQVNEAIRIETRPITKAAALAAAEGSARQRIFLFLVFVLMVAVVALLFLLAV